MNELNDQINQIKNQFFDQLQETRTEAELFQVEKNFLGKKSGPVTQLLKKLSELPPEERPKWGQSVNELKKLLELELAQKRQNLVNTDEPQLWWDYTLDKFAVGRGHWHPISLVLKDMVNFFASMGFEVAQGPEVETEFYNFDALNIPSNHPARDVWDTFYLKTGEVLRTHTSSVQIRTLMQRTPPLRVISPGRCFRYEEVDATHLAVFNQMEGLMIDKNICLSDLKGILHKAIEFIFGNSLKTRFRPAFYPFVEPGLDLDCQCIFCGGSGCSVCKQTGWIELIPCGMVHPNVIRNCGHDPEVYRGFAFGMGFDRIVMLRYGINDMRLLYKGDLNVLSQF
ncbi:MAG: phenylalanine--tRNA ligase subunit alpha [Pyrinomonadaceae bacterium]|nr:phenylalanine--tRNA ligase subunit alpha [Pyrinomonadaceae bacterium]